MKITVFSDVHGNLPALEELLKRESSPDQYVFLGDAVNYGPWSNECVELIAGLDNCIRIQGNHEVNFLEGQYEGTNAVARAFFQYCYPRFTRFERIKEYRQDWRYDGYTCVHTILNKNIYPDTPLDLDDNYFIGHSHHQFGTVSNGFHLYNAGSVGQNRKYINFANYLNWYPEEEKVEMQGFVFDIELVLSEMKAQGYPEECIAYYLSKERK
ncbi:MAG TPA: metallophosphoesterase [Puia sp.]